MSKKTNIRTGLVSAHLWGDFQEGEGVRIGLFSLDLVQKRHIRHQSRLGEVKHSGRAQTIEVRANPPAH